MTLPLEPWSCCNCPLCAGSATASPSRRLWRCGKRCMLRAALSEAEVVRRDDTLLAPAGACDVPARAASGLLCVRQPREERVGECGSEREASREPGAITNALVMQTRSCALAVLLLRLVCYCHSRWIIAPCSTTSVRGLQVAFTEELLDGRRLARIVAFSASIVLNAAVARESSGALLALLKRRLEPSAGEASELFEHVLLRRVKHPTLIWRFALDRNQLNPRGSLAIPTSCAPAQIRRSQKARRAAPARRSCGFLAAGGHSSGFRQPARAQR